MALQAQLRGSFVTGDAQFRPAWAESIVATPSIVASNVHVIDLQTGNTLYTKGTKSDEDVPASLTKLLTAYVLVQLKTEAQLKAQTTVVQASDISDGTTYNLVAGDTISLHALLANTLLPSDNASSSAIARVIGLELLGGSGSDAAAKARFVSEMNSAASSVGMADSSFVDYHGLSDLNSTTPEDINKIAALLVKNTTCRKIWRNTTFRVPVVRSGTPTFLPVSASNDLDGRVGIVGGKTGTLSMYNLTVLWEAPSGHMIAATIMGSTGDVQRFTDMTALLTAIPIDYPSLATPTEVFTPNHLFTDFGLTGAWFDGSDMASMSQDSAGTTPVTATSQPVGKWSPKGGDPLIYFRQSVSGSRPTFNGSLSFDGSNDFLDLGASSFGGSNLFADADDSFMVFQKATTSATTGTLLSKAGATAGNRVLQTYFNSASNAKPGLYVRGVLDDAPAESLNNGVSNGISVWWDGECGAHTRTNRGSRDFAVGTASDTADNITLGAIAGGTSDFFNGTVQHIVLVSGYDLDAYRRMRDWSNGATVNAYALSSGSLYSPVSASSVTAVADGITASLSMAVTLTCSAADAVAEGVTVSLGTAVSLACNAADAVASGVYSSIVVVASEFVICTVANATATGATCSVVVNVPFAAEAVNLTSALTRSAGEGSSVYMGDVGTAIILDCVAEVTDATVRSIKVKKANGVRVTWSAALEGTTKIKYVVLAGDLDVVGNWTLQAYIEMPNWSGSGDAVALRVNRPL